MINLINIAQAGVISDAPRISQLLLNILNFSLQILGLVAIIGIVISGIFYLTSFGDEERVKFAKKSLLYSIVGVVVALGGVVIIKTISGLIK